MQNLFAQLFYQFEEGRILDKTIYLYFSTFGLSFKNDLL